MQGKISRRQNQLYLFDYHSRNGSGLYVLDSTSVLFRFHDLLEMGIYIFKLYTLNLEIQFIKVDKTMLKII